jgi:hypothetical protein
VTKGERIQRSFNRGALFAAMLCAGLAVWTGYFGRAQDTRAFMLFAAIAAATAYSLLWMLGRIIGGLVRLREEREKARSP